TYCLVFSQSYEIISVVDTNVILIFGGKSMADQQVQEKYADLALKTGVNLQKNQALMINAPIEGADFTKIVARKAYEMGAKEVHINWTDDELTLLKFENAPDEIIADFPEWKVKLNDTYAEDGA